MWLPLPYFSYRHIRYQAAKAAFRFLWMLSRTFCEKASRTTSLAVPSRLSVMLAVTPYCL